MMIFYHLPIFILKLIFIIKKENKMKKQQNHGTFSITRKFFSKSILYSGLLLISGFSLAKSPLFEQAKLLQTGTDTVLINIDKSLQLLKKAADQGDTQAQYELAHYYSDQVDYRYVPENNAVYKKMNLDAATKGNFDAYLSLKLEKHTSDILEIETDLTDDLKKINQNVLKLANKGNVDAMHTMMLVLDDDTSGEFSYEQCKWLYKAVQKDVLDAMYSIQYCSDEILKKLGAKTQTEYQTIYEQKDKEHFQSLLAKSKIGDIQAKLELIESYSSPEFLSEKQSEQLAQDIEKHYLSQAAKGASDAYLLLALKKESEEEKQVLYVKAAELNNSVGFAVAGINYLWPDDEKNLNIKKGLEYLEKAASQNNAQALNSLGVWYGDDENEQYDEARAKKYLLQAAKLGSVNGMSNLGRILGEPENYSWAVKAYENGSVEEDILEMALEAYQQGKGTKKNLVKAEKIEKYLQSREDLENHFDDCSCTHNE